MIHDEFYEKWQNRSPCMHEIKEAVPWRETCFGCRDQAHGGLHVRACITDDGYVVGQAETEENENGFPDITHGGVLAAYFDEVLWHQTRISDPDKNAMTIEMDVHYWHPVHQKQKVKIIACPAQKEGRHYYVDGVILLEDGTPASTARIHYLAVDKKEMNEQERKRILHEWQTPEKAIWF